MTAIRTSINNNDFRQSHQPTVSTRQLAKYWLLNISTTDSDTIVFDTYNREVTLNGVSIDNNLTSGQYWRLVPGAKWLIFNTSNSADTGMAIVEWYNLAIGVA